MARPPFIVHFLKGFTEMVKKPAEKGSPHMFGESREATKRTSQGDAQREAGERILAFLQSRFRGRRQRKEAGGQKKGERESGELAKVISLFPAIHIPGGKNWCSVQLLSLPLYARRYRQNCTVRNSVYQEEG